MLQDPVDPAVLYGIRDQRPVRSLDVGVSWEAFDKDLPKGGGAREDGDYGALAAGPDFVVLGGNGGHFYRLDKPAGRWEKLPRGEVDEGDWWGRMQPGT